MIEKLGVSQEQLKTELTQELAALKEKKNGLSKLGSVEESGASAAVDAEIAAVKKQMDELV